MAKKLTKTKARQILHDKEVHGQPLTDKQRRFFGAIAGGAKPYKAENGIEGTMGGLTDKGFNFNPAWGGAWRDGGSLNSIDIPRDQIRPRIVLPGINYNSPQFTKSMPGGYPVNLNLPRMEQEKLGVYARPDLDVWEGKPYMGATIGYKTPKVDVYGSMMYGSPTLGATINFQNGGNLQPPMAGAMQPALSQQFAMGGSLPGSVGFTYARTGGIPSEGPRAKKTMPSAQDGIDQQNLEKAADWYKTWYQQRQALPQFQALAQRRLEGMAGGLPQVILKPVEELQKIGAAAEFEKARSIYPQMDRIYASDPSTVQAYQQKLEKERGRPLEYAADLDMGVSTPVLTHEMSHWFDARFPQSMFSKEGSEKYPTGDYFEFGKKSPLPKDEQKWISSRMMAGNTPLKTEVNAVLNNLRQAEGLRGDQPTTPEQMQKIIEKYRNLPKNKLAPQTKEGSINTIIRTLIESVGGDPEKLSELNNRIVAAQQEGTPMAQNGMEMKYYQEGLDWKPKTISKNGGWLDKFEDGGEIVKDNEGYWNPQNWGKPVEINSNQITMEGVLEPLLGVSDTGDTQMMYPGKNYTFEGTKVVEYPREYFKAEYGKSVNRADEYPLEKLDNLLNFTNYNKPTAKNGKWLDKYK